MNPIKNFNELVTRFRSIEGNVRVAIVCPDDEASQHVIGRCLDERLADFTIITCATDTGHYTAEAEKHPGHVTLLHAASPDEAARYGVELVRSGKADVLMKGIINTDNLMHAVLDKTCGLLPPGNVLSHITLAQIPTYHKLLMFSDATVIPSPNLAQLDAMVRYDTALCHALGISRPKVALIHFSEKINPKFQNTIDYQDIKQRALAGAYGDILIDGPLDVKTSVDLHSCEVKGLASPVAGDADILIFPNLEAGNSFYKTLSFFGHATMAGVISGASSPIVLPSRADSAESKFYSLALACIAFRHNTTA